MIELFTKLLEQGVGGLYSPESNQAIVAEFWLEVGEKEQRPDFSYRVVKLLFVNTESECQGQKVFLTSALWRSSEHNFSFTDPGAWEVAAYADPNFASTVAKRFEKEADMLEARCSKSDLPMEIPAQISFFSGGFPRVIDHVSVLLFSEDKKTCSVSFNLTSR